MLTPPLVPVFPLDLPDLSGFHPRTTARSRWVIDWLEFSHGGAARPNQGRQSSPRNAILNYNLGYTLIIKQNAINQSRKTMARHKVMYVTSDSRLNYLQTHTSKHPWLNGLKKYPGANFTLPSTIKEILPPSPLTFYMSARSRLSATLNLGLPTPGDEIPGDFFELWRLRESPDFIFKNVPQSSLPF